MLKSTTSALCDYVYLVCISVMCRLLVTTGESPIVTDDCFMELYGLQSPIKIIRLIIPGAVRKDTKKKKKIATSI